MDSCSRPAKHAITPPPLYLTAGGEALAYCHTCGRVMSNFPSPLHPLQSNLTPRPGSRKTTGAQTVKYCSERCRHRKPSAADRRIESVFVALLDGGVPDAADLGMAHDDIAAEAEKLRGQPRQKGDARVLVSCEAVERMVYGSRADPLKTFGRRKNRATRALGKDDGPWRSVDMEDTDEEEGAGTDGVDEDGEEDDDHDAYGGVRLANPVRDRGKVPGPMMRGSQMESEVNFSVGGERGRQEKLEETPEALLKRREGERKAEEREMVRRAARRLVAFGVPVAADTTTAPVYEEVSKKAPKGKRGKGDKAPPPEPETRSERRKKCEAIMNSQLVEASYAKGDWSIRWRENDWKRG